MSHPFTFTYPLFYDNLLPGIFGCTSEQGGVKGACSRYVTGIGGETTGDEAILRETTVGMVQASATGNDGHSMFLYCDDG